MGVALRGHFLWGFVLHCPSWVAGSVSPLPR